jgi:hypothetical protein
LTPASPRCSLWRVWCTTCPPVQCRPCLVPC